MKTDYLGCKATFAAPVLPALQRLASVLLWIPVAGVFYSLIPVFPRLVSRDCISLVPVAVFLADSSAVAMCSFARCSPRIPLFTCLFALAYSVPGSCYSADRLCYSVVCEGCVCALALLRESLSLLDIDLHD